MKPLLVAPVNKISLLKGLTLVVLCLSMAQGLYGNERLIDRLNFSLSPHFGEVSLAAGFTPDPHTVTITSGGMVNTNYLPGECTGWASEAPDFRLSWTGSSEELRFLFEANEYGDDATLIINQPDGSWICNDDADYQTLNPMVILSNPMVGQYDIWVGSYAEGEYITGQLYITELEIMPGDGSYDEYESYDLDFTLDALYGDIRLTEGFVPDPHTAFATAGGNVNLSVSLASAAGCAGFASPAPDFKLYWTGSTADLTIFFSAETPGDDTVLVVNTPNGQWICNDDAHDFTLNPQLSLSAYGEGRYDIWIATYDEGDYVRGTLSITEMGATVD